MNSDKTGGFWIQWLSLGFAGLTGLVGLLVIIGWYIHSVSLVQIHPSFVPMQYNTALGFLLSGTALVFIALSRYPRASDILGGLISTIGFLTLVEYGFGLNLGIDELFMEHYIGVKTSHPGRMAPNTALCFFLSGLVFWGLSRYPVRQNVTGSLAALVFGLGTVALIGYISGLEGAYGWGKLTRMAVHTSISFILVAIGSLTLLVWRNGKEGGHWYNIKWLPTAVFLGFLTITLSWWQVLNLGQNETFVRWTGLLGGTLDAFLFFFVVLFAQKWRINGQKMHENNLFMDSVIENIPNALFVQDSETLRILMVNRAGEKLLGKPRQEIIGKSVFDIFPRQLADNFDRHDKKILKGVTLVGSEEKLEVAEGKKAIHLSKLPVFGEYKQVRYILSIIEDVTEKRKLEEEVGKRQEESERNNRLLAMGTMAGGISHEINNPLSIISLVSANLKNIASQPKQSIDRKKVLDQCEIIDSTVARIAKIVKGLKTISRDVSGDPMVPESLSELVNNTLIICQEKFSRGNVKICLEGDFEQKVNCRGGEISQVLLNLLSNAHDEIVSQKDAWIEIHVKNQQDNTVLSVIDSGKGIESKYINRIMDPFFTTKPVGKGVGLGLSICSRIMEAHGGRLEVDSDCPNTKFDMIFPLVKEDSLKEAA